MPTDSLILRQFITFQWGLGSRPFSPVPVYHWPSFVSHLPYNQALMNTVVLPLSPTEKRILGLFDQGRSYKEIADAVGCSINTVKTHAKKILVKTIANNLRHAAYLRRGSPDRG